MTKLTKLLLVVAAVATLPLVQPVKAVQKAQGGPAVMTVPDSGSTISLLSFAFLGVIALQRKLRR